MRVQSIGTAIKPGDPACDRFFCSTGEVPFRKMHCIAEAHDVAQEIRAVAEAFQNAGHLLTARVRAPFVVYLRNLTSGVGILNDFDLGLRVWHDRRLAYLLQQRRKGSIEFRFDGAQIQEHLVFVNASHHGRLKPAKCQQKCLGLQYRVMKRNSCALKPRPGRCSPTDQA